MKKIAKTTSKPVKKTCKVKGCTSPPWSKRAGFCTPHLKKRRKVQLKRNNLTWRPRKKKGIVKQPHVLYKGKPTKTVAKHKDLLKLAQKLIVEKAKAKVLYTGQKVKGHVPMKTKVAAKTVKAKKVKEVKAKKPAPKAKATQAKSVRGSVSTPRSSPPMRSSSSSSPKPKASSTSATLPKSSPKKSKPKEVLATSEALKISTKKAPKAKALKPAVVVEENQTRDDLIDGLIDDPSLLNEESS